MCARAALTTMLSLVLLDACGDGKEAVGLNGESLVSSQGEQVNGACPSSPTQLKGSRSPGTSCSHFRDCKPVCCSCPAGKHWLAAACVDGACASSTEACAQTNESFFCDGTVRRDGGVSVTPSRDHGTSGAPLCVAGESSYCYASGGKWTGSLCCINGVGACVAGESSYCYASGGKWTGSLCCIKGAATCVEGESSYCYASGGKWTGARCCLDGVVTCVKGSSSNCYASGGKWTGALCCVK